MHSRFVAALSFAGLTIGASAQTETWRQVRPSNTGIPGIQLHYSTTAPDGRLWIVGRWPFWGEGGIGAYDVENDLWETWSNVDTPQPSQWVNEVAFDAAGVAWIATDDGLARKDGDNWTVWSTTNAPFLHNQIDDVAIAPNGDVWINNTGVQTTSAAVFRFSGGVWTKFQVPQIPFAPPWNNLGEVLVTPDGHVWVSNETLNGVAEYDGQTWTMRGETVGRFGQGLVDNNGDLWFVAGIGGGAQWWRYRRAANQWEQYSAANTPLPQTTVTRVFKDASGNIYVGNWFGHVVKFDGASWSLVCDVNDAVYGLEVTPDGHMWVSTLGNGTTGELHHLNQAGNPIRRYNTWNTGMPEYIVDGMSVDPQGDLWLATGEAGLSRYDGVRWRNWGNHNSGSEPYPFAGNEPMGAFYQDRNGTGWMGGNGIARWDRASGQFTGFWNWQNNPGMGVTLFASFAEDGAGNLFSSTEYGATFRFDGAQWVSQPPVPGSYTSTYAGVKADSQGRVWAMGWLKAFLWDGAAWTEVGQAWDIFNRGGINCYDIAADDTLWIGTNEGLLRVSPQGQTTFYTPANSPLPAKEVQGIDIRADGVIAVSAHEFQSVTPFPSGVAVINGDPSVAANWSIYGYGTHPIRHYQLGTVQFDGEGDLWISALTEGCTVLEIGARPCYPDCNADGALNLADFGCFQTRFALGDPQADCNGDAVLNLADFGCFQTTFALGCP